MKIVAMLDLGKFRLIVRRHDRKLNPFEVCFRIRGHYGWIDTTLENYASLESCLCHIEDYIASTEDAQEAVRADTPNAIRKVYG